MDRRTFLTLLGVMTGLPLVSRCTAQPVDPQGPRVVFSRDGRLQVELTAALTRVDLGRRWATLMTYNRQIPGPRLEVKPGDRLQIRFTNHLPDPTNLHFHGLHISPTGLADDPFRVVSPGATVEYDVTIPENHPSGLFWYHPHYHGLVAQQVFSGLSGLLVVRGDLDEQPELQAAQEQFLVLQDFDLNRWGQVRDPLPAFRRWGREGGVVTINGQSPPILDLPQGGLLRLRVLNASASRLYPLQLQGHPWWLAATDGGVLEEPVVQDIVQLGPGERVDLLVPGQAEVRTYSLVSLPYDRGITAMAKAKEQARSREILARSTEPVAIAQVRYQPAEASPVSLPLALGPVEPLPEPGLVREFVLDHGMDPETRDPFLINGRAFGHHRVDTQVSLGTVEDWVIINKAGLDHSFHLHTNPFQVVSRNGQPEDLRAWKDVVHIPAYETVKIRIPFRDFAGKTVYHCHVLDHEDQGMMGVITMN